MKSAIFYPKFKKRCTKTVGNYQLISILPTQSQYLERAIYNQLLGNLNVTRAKGKSTNTALYQLLCGNNHLLGEQKFSLRNFCRPSCSLDQQSLLTKFRELNIKESALAWIISYFCERTQQIDLKYYNNQYEPKARFDLLTFHQSIPQGLILGPPMFLIYTNFFFQHQLLKGKKQLCSQIIQQLSLPQTQK